MEEISVRTKGDGDTIDITSEVEKAVQRGGVRDGAAVVSISGSTASITTIEFEPGAVADLKAALDRIAPAGGHYAHNHGGDSNGHAHARAAIVGPSVTIPVSGGRLVLGTWQQIVLVDFDNRARSRTVQVQILG
ncbi:MAG: secondary thiamine-phosphate synthase enzyme YjbQ [Actinomycetota bacterium]|nr:secondary thiamine-phosphate synthase enzyme YjbQ [Actinomycetota bacterium]